MTEPLYSGEAILLNWHDNKSGRKIVLQIEKDGPGAHPFDGMDGERFAVVIVGPLTSTQHAQDEQQRSPAPRVRGAHGAGDDTAEGVRADADAPAPAKPKKRWHEMPASQRAGMLVNDPEFQRYATEWNVGDVEARYNESNTDVWLKAICGVDSKSSILPGTTAYEKFVEIEGNFHAWRQARQHGVTS